MKEKFIELTKKNQQLSSAMIFSKLVKDRKMSRPEIAKWLDRLVDVNDYDNMDKKKLRVFYYKLSNGLK